ncbi:MAG: tetratricopeptide repeat protein [Acidobacteria bacterium]|nr:tetratricopeptide repeat protein [Acidobacteriota bacterium]
MRPLVPGPVVVAAVVCALVSGVAAPAGAANREHQQMMADIRMLQEQNQQLQVTLLALSDALRAITARIDDQSAQTQKAFADQRLLVDTLTGELRVVREKIDDSNVRIASLRQEIEAVRLSIPMMPAGGAPETAPVEGADPTATPPPAPLPSPVAGMAPQRLYDTAYADFASGQWGLAIQGFEAYIRSFPRSDLAERAQFYIAESYDLDGKPEQAITAYDQVIANYPTGEQAPFAYYKRGLLLARLGQVERARESWETTIQKYPDSDASRLAKQRLDQLRRPGR